MLFSLVSSFNTNKSSDNVLVDEVVIPNLPCYLMDDFELTHRVGDDIKRIIRYLTLIMNKTQKSF